MLCCAVQSIKPVVEKMKAAGVPVDLFMYEHCGHAFMNALTAGGREKIKGTPLCF
jgi:acetyl esterase/lipase